MARDFLTEAQDHQYGRYECESDEVQLTRYFHLADTDRILTNNCRGDYNRLGFAWQLTTVRFLGTFLSDPTQVPRSVLRFAAHQHGITHNVSFDSYMNRDATRAARHDGIATTRYRNP